MKRTVNIWANLDWFTVFIFLLLVIMGWFNIYAAVYSEEHNSIFDLDMRYGKQMIWIIAAFIMAAIIMFIDLRFYSFFAYVIFALTTILLFAVALVGKEVNGARSWFEIGSLRLQPTEFAKIATCLALAKYLSSYNVKIEKLKTLFIVALIIFIPTGLIMMQPDFGSVIVFLSLAFVLYREGFPGGFLFFGFLLVFLFVFALVATPLTILIFIISIALFSFLVLNRKYKEPFIGLLSIGAIYCLLYGINRFFKLHYSSYFLLLYTSIFIGIVTQIINIFKKIPNAFWIVFLMFVAISFTYSIDYVFDNLLDQHQKQRVNILLGKETDLQGAEYNVNQSKIAIGSGGFFGKGFLQGTQTKFNFVPEQSTDFIFCTVGEEWGFLGSFFVIGLFGLLLVRIIYLCERQRSAFSRIYGYGVVSILFFHIAINIGMTIGALPVIGIPLPFFSYGGSSLWAFTILLFIFLRLDASRLELFQ
jgi:rod shape determining protein RodA